MPSDVRSYADFAGLDLETEEEADWATLWIDNLFAAVAAAVTVLCMSSLAALIYWA